MEKLFLSNLNESCLKGVAWVTKSVIAFLERIRITGWTHALFFTYGNVPGGGLLSSSTLLSFHSFGGYFDL